MPVCRELISSSWRWCPGMMIDVPELPQAAISAGLCLVQGSSMWRVQSWCLDHRAQFRVVGCHLSFLLLVWFCFPSRRFRPCFACIQVPLVGLGTIAGRNKVYASWKLHKASRSAADHISKPIVCGRCWGGSIITRFYIYEIKKLLEGGNSTGVQQSSMLGLYGERVCRTRSQTYLLWEAQEVQLSVLQCIYIYIISIYYIYIYICMYRYIHIWTFSKIGILVPKL